MADAVVDDVLVDFVGDQVQAVFLDDVGELAHVGLVKHRTRRVVRRVGHDHPRLRGDRIAHLLPIRRKGFGIERHVHRARTGEVDRRLVAVVARIEHDHFLARAHHGVDGVEDRFGGTAADGDFRVRIGTYAVAALGLVGDRLPQPRCAHHHRVLVGALAHRPVKRVDQPLGHREVGKALAEIDCAVLRGELRHHGEDGGADLG